MKIMKVKQADGSIVSIPLGQGANGKSAYEYAKDGGYTGTEAEFAILLASIENNTGGVDVEVVDTKIAAHNTDTSAHADIRIAIDSKANKSEGAFFIQGSGTTDADAKTSTWTGTTDRITSYYDGLTIRYKIGVAGQTTTTLNINGLGAEPVYLFNTTKLTTQFPVGSIIHLTYHTDLNSGCWMCSDYDANSNTVPTPHCTTSAGTTAKTATCTYFTLKDPSYMVVTIRYSNTSTGALTLNINSTGAKPIFIDGVRASSSNAKTLVAGTYFVRYEGGNYYFNTNNVIPGTVTSAQNANTAGTADYANDSDKLDGHDSSYFATKEELNALTNAGIIIVQDGDTLTIGGVS